MPFHVGHKGHSAAQITKSYLHARSQAQRGERASLVSAVCAVLNHYGIPLLPHTIDILCTFVTPILILRVTLSAVYYSSIAAYSV